MVEIENWQTLDDKGILMPWYTRPCLEWLDKLDIQSANIWEYGVGHSTNWYNSRGGYCVFGVDDKKEWVKDYCTQYEYEKERYLNAIYEHEMKFDLIAIDGSFRDECLQHALNCIHKDGFIIIDNYKQATADLAEWPITEKLIENLDVHFYKEPTHEDWVTLVIHV